MANAAHGRQLTTALTARYVLVLLVLAGLSLGSFLVLDEVIAGSEGNAALVNVSGRQRMLSQRIALLSEHLAIGTDAAARRRTRELLVSSIDLMERSHGALTGGDPALNLPATMSDDMRAMYFDPESNLDGRVGAYLDRARALAATPDSGLGVDNRDLVFILQVAPGELLRSLDAAVAQYQKEGERKIADLHRKQVYGLAVILVVLLLSGFLVFRPLVERIRLDDVERGKAEARLKQAHRELEAKAVDLEEANEVLSEYAYAVSHDLKAPLRAIRGYSDFLLEDLGGSLSEDVEDYLNGLVKATGEAEELVEDLLVYGQVGTGEAVYEELELGGLVEEAVASLSLGDGVEVEITGEWPTLTSSPTLLKQIVVNLVGNGVKFNRQPVKRVEIDCQANGGGFCRVSVKDNGIGIDERFFDRVFQMFQRLHTRTEFEGTGIGLAIVKKAASRLGGSVAVASRPGVGSTFTVSLPVKRTE